MKRALMAGMKLRIGLYKVIYIGANIFGPMAINWIAISAPSFECPAYLDVVLNCGTELWCEIQIASGELLIIWHWKVDLEFIIKRDEFIIERNRTFEQGCKPCMLFLPSLVLLALLVVESVGEGCLLPLLPARGTAAAMATAPACGSQSIESACNLSSSVMTFMLAR